MSTSVPTSASTRENHTAPAFRDDRRSSTERLTTETKSAFKTTEFIAYLAVLAGLLIAGLVVDNQGAGGFGAQDVWKYVTILTVGYMVSRGLAKAGSRDPYTRDVDSR